MSDISLHFTWLDWIVIAVAIGWPGLLAGGALGALISRRRRLGAAIDAVAGCVLVFVIRVFAR